MLFLEGGGVVWNAEQVVGVLFRVREVRLLGICFSRSGWTSWCWMLFSVRKW